MKQSINLLPWRMRQQRQQTKALIGKILACALLCGFGGFALNTEAEQHSATAENLQTDLQQAQRELQLTQQQIRQFRHHNTPAEAMKSLPADILFALLDQLNGLPLTQGELTESALDAQRLTLTGYSISQEEFSRVNRFLTQQPLFADVKLTEFKPQQEDMQFQFDLTLRVNP